MKKKNIIFIIIFNIILVSLISLIIIRNEKDKLKENEIKSSIRSIISYAETNYISNLFKEKITSTINLSKTKLEYGGIPISKGYIRFDENGKATGEFYIDNYCASYSNSDVIINKTKDENCEIEVPITFPIENGTEVYFNPNTGKQCTSKEVVSSKTGVKEGCMKWYAFLDNGEEYVKLLLDHNTTDFVLWNNNNGTTPDIVMEQLEKDTENWEENVKSRARLISAREVNKIAPSLYDWDIRNGNTMYYLHTGTKTQYLGEAGSNNYAWLFDNVRNCEQSGCNNQDYDTYGYWTSDYSEDKFAWAICFGGSLHGHAEKDILTDGLRPVIEVSKALFK